MIKVGIYSPYLKMMGGGERYILSIASAFASTYEVYLYADENIQEKANSVFGINLDRVHFLPENLLHTQNVFNRFINLRQYDLFFYMTDGSVFFSGAGKNYLIIQSPLHIPQKSLLNLAKLTNWKILCYSNFMKSVIRQRLWDKAKIITLPPCINVPKDRQNKKQNIILSVGRFFSYPHDKKHKILVDFFKAAYKNNFLGWKLVIAGGLTEKSGRQILFQLKTESRGFPIEIMVNLTGRELGVLYQKAKIYWHAAGFGEDLAKYPQKAEHFGITPIEAMSYGTVPLVFNGGGLPDIIKEGQGGYLWDSEKELINKTADLIENPELLKKQNSQARLNAKDYSFDKFYEKLGKIIEG